MSVLYVLFSGKVGTWKSHFTVAQNDAIEETYRARLEEIGIEFQYDIDS